MSLPFELDLDTLVLNEHENIWSEVFHVKAVAGHTDSHTHHKSIALPGLLRWLVKFFVYLEVPTAVVSSFINTTVSQQCIS